jgi:hypothetical protein
MRRSGVRLSRTRARSSLRHCKRYSLPFDPTPLRVNSFSTLFLCSLCWSERTHSCGGDSGGSRCGSHFWCHRSAVHCRPDFHAVRRCAAACATASAQRSSDSSMHQIHLSLSPHPLIASGLFAANIIEQRHAFAHGTVRFVRASAHRSRPHPGSGANRSLSAALGSARLCGAGVCRCLCLRLCLCCSGGQEPSRCCVGTACAQKSGGVFGYAQRLCCGLFETSMAHALCAYVVVFRRVGCVYE